MIQLSQISAEAPEDAKKKDFEEKTEQLCEELAELQHILYAQKKYSLLVVLQGMDASGKDGITRRVFGACSPTGLSVYSFKKPTEEEMAHDFLWRVHQQAPRKGMITVFNRSHYEDILIQRVHQWIDDERAGKRMASINAFEELLQYDNNTSVLKFYLHISREKQREELQERIDEKRKRWKHNPNDWKEAERWDDYRRCYEYAINNSTIPWHIIPVDNGWYGDYLVAKTVVEELQSLDLELPGLV